MDITVASLLLLLLLLLQAALGGALTIILALALIGGAVLLAAMLGGTLVGDESAKAEATDPILPPGTILGASGLSMAAIGAFYSFTFTFLGMMLGALAYYRGARAWGLVVVVLSFVGVFVAFYSGAAENAEQFTLWGNGR